MGPRGNTLSILKVNANKAKNALIPPPIIKVNNRFPLMMKSIKEKINGMPIQINGALKRFLLLLVE
jgi:hypothetical protein